jgi:hypothetical protein
MWQINDWLINMAGKILMLTGIIGLGIDIFYDLLVGRSDVAFTWGYMQVVAGLYCIFLIYTGWIFNNFVKDIREE